jgi:phospholipase/carboxylesterase
MSEKKHLPSVEINSSLSPNGTVIWLHGLGANGHDLESVIPELRLPHSMAIRFIFPHAPIRSVTLNNGSEMRAWFDIYALDFLQEDIEGIYAAQQWINQLIERESQRGIPTDRIVLAGFSQGGALALHTGLRYKKALAGIMALSTYLPLHKKMKTEACSVNQRIPIFMAHGKQDAVIPFFIGESVEQSLSAKGYQVEFHAYPMAHQLCPEEIKDISAWLQRVL